MNSVEVEGQTGNVNSVEVEGQTGNVAKFSYDFSEDESFNYGNALK